MARRVFFSFHYQRDVWRVNQIRNIHNVIGTAAAGFQDASLWEEAKKKGEEDKEFIIKELEPWALHIVYVNGQSVLTPKLGKHTAEIRYIESEFKRLMG